MDERALREKEIYDSQTIERGKYENVLRHTRKSYYHDYSKSIITKILQFGENKDVLELGAQTWHSWLYHNNIIPSQVTCINISDSELEKGIQWYQKTDGRMHVDFRVMDANDLKFEDESFDMVFGFGILHHLAFSKAINEIHRVLKRNGQIMFYEPLGLNPIAKLVRLMTPKARTRDERPLGKRELCELMKLFDVHFYYEQLFSVIFGIVSPLIFESQKNPLMKFAFSIDRFFDEKIPLVRPYFRNIIMHGEKI